MNTEKKQKYTKIAKITGWVIMALVLIPIGALMAAGTILKPDRLTAVIKKSAEKELNADVNIGHAELTVWSTFPNIHIDIDDAAVISGAFKDFSDDQREYVPQYGDTLATLKKFSGGVNMFSLLSDEIALRDIVLTRPCINIVETPYGANYDIVRSDKDSKSPYESVDINSMKIVDAGPIRWVAPESQMAMQLTEFDMQRTAASSYNLAIAGTLDEPTLPLEEPLTFSLKGAYDFEKGSTSRVALKGINFGVGFVKGSITSDILIGPNVVFNSLDLHIDPIAVENVKKLMDFDAGNIAQADGDVAGYGDDDLVGDDDLPEFDDADLVEIDDDYADDSSLPAFDFKALDTNATVGIDFKITKPWTIKNNFDLPYGTLGIKIAPCHLTYDGIKFDRLSADALINISPDIDNISVTVNDLQARGSGIDIALKGRLVNPLDPQLDFRATRAQIDLAKAPAALMDILKSDLLQAVINSSTK